MRHGKDIRKAEQQRRVRSRESHQDLFFRLCRLFTYDDVLGVLRLYRIFKTVMNDQDAEEMAKITFLKYARGGAG